MHSCMISHVIGIEATLRAAGHVAQKLLVLLRGTRQRTRRNMPTRQRCPTARTLLQILSIVYGGGSRGRHGCAQQMQRRHEGWRALYIRSDPASIANKPA